MAASEKMIRVAAELYHCRDSVRTLFGERYQEIIGGYAKTIRHVAKERKIDTLVAAMEMSKEMKATFCDPIIPICLLAAAVEIAEPSAPTVSGES